MIFVNHGDTIRSGYILLSLLKKLMLGLEARQIIHFDALGEQSLILNEGAHPKIDTYVKFSMCINYSTKAN